MIEIFTAILIPVAYITGRIIGQEQTKKNFMRVYKQNQRLIKKGKAL
tara:strand:+ start:66 stop:206 length:141 start_codon:yes stop_codon:yes gene_type:complete